MHQEVNNMEERLNEIYGKIADTLNDTIPEEWDKIYMYGEIGEGVREAFFYYYPSESNEPVYSHKIPEIFDISEDEYDKLWYQLLDNLTELWNEFKNNGQETPTTPPPRRTTPTRTARWATPTSPARRSRPSRLPVRSRTAS